MAGRPMSLLFLPSEVLTGSSPKATSQAMVVSIPRMGLDLLQPDFDQLVRLLAAVEQVEDGADVVGQGVFGGDDLVSGLDVDGRGSGAAR